jgi:hypothetical protein
MSTAIICDYELQKSAVVEHSVNCGDRLQQNARILAKKSRSRDRFNRKSIDIYLDPNSINGEDGFSVIRSGNPLIH